MPLIRISPAAHQDLVEIMAYIADELNSPEAAGRIVTKIVNICERLAEFPLSGARLAAIVGQDIQHRYLVCNNYLIFYIADAEYVSICKILYGKRNYLNILFSEEIDSE